MRSYRDGELMFETGKPGPGMFVILSGQVAVHGTGRAGPCHARDHSGPWPVHGRTRSTLRPCRAGRRPGRRQCRNPFDSAGPASRPVGGRGRSWRTDHASADPAPRWPPSRRRRWSDPDRRADIRRRDPVAGFSHPTTIIICWIRHRTRTPPT